MGKAVFNAVVGEEMKLTRETSDEIDKLVDRENFYPPAEKTYSGRAVADEEELICMIVTAINRINDRLDKVIDG